MKGCSSSNILDVYLVDFYAFSCSLVHLTVNIIFIFRYYPKATKRIFGKEAFIQLKQSGKRIGDLTMLSE
jgi:hypothetical protein